MIDRLLADSVLVVHLLFIGFVMIGGFITLRYPGITALHIPAVCWGVFVELSGHTCPLTAIEIGFRNTAGDAGYSGSFIEHYLVPIIYPAGLTREIQLLLGGIVILTNAGVYAYRVWRYQVAASKKAINQSATVLSV